MMKLGGWVGMLMEGMTLELTRALCAGMRDARIIPRSCVPECGGGRPPPPPMVECSLCVHFFLFFCFCFVVFVLFALWISLCFPFILLVFQGLYNLDFWVEIKDCLQAAGALGKNSRQPGGGLSAGPKKVD